MRPLQMAESVDHRAFLHAHAGAEDDVGLDRHVTGKLRVIGEEDRLRRDQRDALAHRLLAALRLPARFHRCQLGPAVDTGDLRGIGLDHRARPAVRRRQHNDVRQIIFARRIVVPHPREQREQIGRARRHEAGVAQRDRPLRLVRVLIFDHPLDPAARVGDHAAVGGGIVRTEAEHHARRCVGPVQPLDHGPHRLGADERHVTIKDEHIAFEARERRLGLRDGMAGAELLGLKRDPDAAPRHRLLDLLAPGADHDHLPLGRQLGHARQQVQQHRPPGHRMKHLV